VCDGVLIFITNGKISDGHVNKGNIQFVCFFCMFLCTYAFFSGQFLCIFTPSNCFSLTMLFLFVAHNLQSPEL